MELAGNSDPVFVGLIQLTLPLISSSGWERGLSAQDRERADRFRIPKDRARFILGRRLLGFLCRKHLQYPFGPLELAFSKQGRPYLATEPNVTFSITHAGDLVGVALAAGARVGLDVESLDRRIKLGPLAERILHPKDHAQFLALPEGEQPNAFFRAWTGKEAILKALGIGLLGDVRQISVPLDGQAATVGCTHEGQASAWRLWPLVLPTGHVGSLACDDPGKTVDLRIYEPEELAQPT
jgi:4'-phosphopantetheinyl transferase